jgi:hypothetical protein
VGRACGRSRAKQHSGGQHDGVRPFGRPVDRSRQAGLLLPVTEMVATAPNIQGGEPYKNSGDQESSHILHLGIHREEQRGRRSTYQRKLRLFFVYNWKFTCGSACTPSAPADAAARSRPRHHLRRVSSSATCSGGADASSRVDAS